MEPVIAVIIPTKNRSEAIEQYALASLARSSFREFVCVVWDASEDDLTRRVVENRIWSFEALYFKAPRKGLASQRNDAVKYVLDTFPGVRHVVFMDDDSEFSKDALAGVAESFEKQNVLLVNIPTKPPAPFSWRTRSSLALKRLLRMNRHGVTPFLYNYGGEDEAGGCDVEWTGGCGMGVDVSVFRDMEVFFPEEFQYFGGYALGEDLAFSLYVSKKLGGRIINSLYGYCKHHAVGSPRLSIQNMAASKWYNFHLLFDAIYGEEKQGRVPQLRFKLFMAAAALKLLVRAPSFNLAPVLRGISEARHAYRRYRSENDIRFLMRAPLKE